MHTRKRLSPRTLLATALCLGAAIAFAQTAAPNEGNPLLMFKATFDNGIDTADVATGQKEFVPSIYDRSAEPRDPRWSGWQIEKDYKGMRAAPGAEGFSGSYLSVPVGKGQRFREIGNANMRRGTISFRYRNNRAPSEAQAILLKMSGARMYVRARYERMYVSFHKVKGGNIRLPIEANSVGEWHHLGLVYDARYGCKVYFNGKLVKARWDSEQYSFFTEDCEPDLLMLGCEEWRGGQAPFDIDEVCLFSEALSAESVALLASGRELAEGEATFEDPGDSGVFREHRLAELGWDSEGDFPQVSPGRPLMLRKLGVLESRAVRAWRTGAVDGVPGTFWPPSYQGYNIPDQGLHLRLEDGAEVEHMTLRGGFAGEMYAGMGIERPGDTPSLATLRGNAGFMRRTFEQPIKESELSFFRNTDIRSGKQGNIIRELDFYRSIPPDDAILSAPSRTLYFSPRAYEPGDKGGDNGGDNGLDKWISWRIRSLFDPRERGRLKLETGAPADGGALKLPALLHTHFFMEPSGDDIPLAGIGMRLVVANPERPARLRLQVRDPADSARLMLDLHTRLVPARGAATARFDFALDTQDVMIPADAPLWITLTPEEDLEILLGGADSSSVKLLLGERSRVLAEYVRNLLGYAKDSFNHVSEQRPWGKVSLEQCSERLAPYRRLERALRSLDKHAPEHINVNALWVWTHPWGVRDYNTPPRPEMNGAPEWAVYARETMRLVHDFALWWVENRQIPNGLFGSAHGDDTDLVQDWPNPALVYDKDGRLAHSLRLISDYCWNEGPMQDGINKRITDTLHAYEEGVNTQPWQALLYYGNPVYTERLLDTSRTVRDYLTYTTEEGQRFFKANFYGTDGIRTEYAAGRDFPRNALLMHPTLYLAYYSRNPGAMKLLEEWGGSWADIISAAIGRNGVNGEYPHYVAYPDAKITYADGESAAWYGFDDICLGMYTMTGEEKYFDPFRLYIDKGSFSRFVTADWYAVRDMSEYRESLLERVEGIDWEPLNPLMGDDVRSSLAYMGWLATGSKRLVEDACEAMWRRLAVLYPMHTWSEQSADRVAVSAEIVSRMYLGGTPGKRNKLWPTHTVSWEGMDEDFAAWVLESGPRELRVWVYNFKPHEHVGRMRVWGLEDGVYRLRAGVDAEQSGVLETESWSRRQRVSRNTPLELRLPSRELVLVELAQAEKGPPLFNRADLAVVDTDMEYDAAGGVLRYVVHNIGSVAAENFKVRVEGDGRLLSERTVPVLESPDDLMPRVMTFEQPVSGSRRLVITVDPDNSVLELWKENNIAEFSVPSPEGRVTPLP